SDRRIINALGIDAALKSMSNNHLYVEEYIRELWGRIGDLRTTDFVLGEMKKGAEERGNVVLEGLELDLHDVGEKSRQRRERRQSDSWMESFRGENSFFAERSRRSLSSVPSRNLELQIKTAPLDDVTGYLPPESSRAGQFKRLEGEGRRDEALRRERR